MVDAPRAPDANEADGRFYRGVVLKLSRGAQCGTIRSGSGRELPFIFAHVTMVGARRRFDDLREGMHVGYDVSWTSKGLRVSVIRIPD
jgi:cold shock CspA family protein